MEIKFGLISCDSHGQLDRDAWTSRMSKAKWGDRDPAGGGGQEGWG